MGGPLKAAENWNVSLPLEMTRPALGYVTNSVSYHKLYDVDHEWWTDTILEIDGRDLLSWIALEKLDSNNKSSNSKQSSLVSTVLKSLTFGSQTVCIDYV